MFEFLTCGSSVSDLKTSLLFCQNESFEEGSRDLQPAGGVLVSECCCLPGWRASLVCSLLAECCCLPGWRLSEPAVSQ